MKNKNICKFVGNTPHTGLTTTRFIYETQVPPGEWTWLATADTVFLVTDGRGSMTVGSVEHSLSKGTLFFVFAGETRHLYNEDGLQYLYINYTGDRVAELYARFHITENDCVATGMEGLIPLWKESLVKADGENIDLLSESMLLYAFAFLQKREAVPDEFLHVITAYMEENFTDSGLTLKSMAAELGYSEKYLSHQIVRHLGVGFSEHLKTMRIRYAVLLIHQGVTSVKNIAILCGFTDPLYFSKVFKQSLGVSPKEYIEKPPVTPRG